MKAYLLVVAGALGAAAAALALRRRRLSFWRRGEQLYVDAAFVDLLLERGARSEVRGDVLELRVAGQVFGLRELNAEDIERLDLGAASGSVYEATGPLELLFVSGLLREGT